MEGKGEGDRGRMEGRMKEGREAERRKWEREAGENGGEWVGKQVCNIT